MRILLIEDNPGDARLIREMLTGINGGDAELECEETLMSGLERLGNEEFDLLLLDLNLPGSRGLETLQRARPFQQKVPLVVLTGLEDEEAAQRSLESGAQDYLVKGKITADSLGRAIRYAMGRRSAEEALRVSEKQFRLLVESASEVIMTTDLDLIVAYASPSIERQTGFTAEEVVGRDCSEFMTAESFDVIAGVLSEQLAMQREMAVATHKPVMIEVEQCRKDGSTYPAEISAGFLRDQDDAPSGVIVVSRDITEKRAAEEALLESRAAFEQQAQDLRDMLTIASHELRHPAAVFKGYSHILLENAGNLDSEVVRDALMSIDSASDRLERTVNQLLDASRIEGREMSLRFEELEPRTLLGGITAEFQYTGAEIVTTDKTGAGAVFKADGEKLQAVLANLVENAVKYSSNGSPIGVCVEPASGGLLFSVCDEGPGISEEHATLVFERFYQVEEVRHHSLPGMGLGLYIAKAIVDEHGGWIRYRPGEGGGSVFEFFIPGHPKAEACPETYQEHTKKKFSPPCEPRLPDEIRDDAGLNDDYTKRVLRVAVIDDDPVIVKVNMMMLKSRGYEAIAAHSGEEGLEMVIREIPDVVLLDIMMPGLDGIQTCRRLKSNERTRDIPVIFVTAKTSEKCREEAYAAGGSGFLSKPYKPDELFESIEEVCNLARTGVL